MLVHKMILPVNIFIRGQNTLTLYLILNEFWIEDIINPFNDNVENWKHT